MSNRLIMNNREIECEQGREAITSNTVTSEGTYIY
jgi:hypothetical protein